MAEIRTMVQPKQRWCHEELVPALNEDAGIFV